MYIWPWSVKKEDNHPKPSWKKATEAEKANYSEILESQLSCIQVPNSLHCMNVKCQDEDHCSDADTFITSVLECVESVATCTLPSPSLPSSSSPSSCASSSTRKPVPGWKNYVEPFRDKAHFWHQVWISAGKPMNTELHRILIALKKEIKSKSNKVTLSIISDFKSDCHDSSSGVGSSFEGSTITNYKPVIV